MGRAGIVLGLEVSRLARNCADWHRLLEICGLTDTLILDEDGIDHPGDFNDRLLLGLKGEMSAAELHIIRGRLRGGLLNKAKRGELAMQLPLGLAYDDAGRAVLDPDKPVQQAFRLLFETFRRVGTAFGVVRVFCRQGLSFPRGGAAPGDGSGANWNITRSFVLCATHAMPELISTAEPSTEKRSRGEARSVRGCPANSGTH